MDFFRFLIILILGFLLSGVWFGLCFIMQVLTRKFKIPCLSYLNKLLVSLILIFFISSTLGIYPIQIGGIQNIRVYIVAIVTIVITTAIITRKKSVKCKTSKELLIWGLDGIIMEIPQRLMMQSFIYGMLKLLGVSLLNFYTIIATALIWCMGIAMQTILLKNPFDEDLIFNITSSLVFP